MPFHPYAFAVFYAGSTSAARKARYNTYYKDGEFKIIRRRSQKLKIVNPLTCNDCGAEFIRKRSGPCKNCKSKEFVYMLNGRAVFVDFKDNFTRYIPESAREIEELSV